METVTNAFVVDATKGAVGKSVIKQPKIKFDRSKSGIKWFDDSKLLKGRKVAESI